MSEARLEMASVRVGDEVLVEVRALPRSVKEPVAPFLARVTAVDLHAAELEGEHGALRIRSGPGTLWMSQWKGKGKGALWRPGSPGAAAAERRYLAARLLAARPDDLAAVPAEALRCVLDCVQDVVREREARRKRGWRPAPSPPGR